MTGKMTGKQLAAALEAAGISQTDLGRRLFLNARTIRKWVDRGVPPRRLESVLAQLRARPRIFLNREERSRIAELLDITARGVYPPGKAAREVMDEAARYRDKIRAGLGGVLEG